MNAAKVIYVHRNTNEVIEDILPDMPWYKKAFYEMHVKLDLEVDEDDFDTWDWTLQQFIAPDILVFTFNSDSYTY